MKKLGGRPSKFNIINKDQMKKLALAGWDDSMIADFFSINPDTLYEWKKKNKEFSEALKSWKAEADLKVERSLYESACGFRTKCKKAFVVSDGRDSGSHVELIEEEVVFPPNATSIIFWLKNRQPKIWRDKAELDINETKSLYLEFRDLTKEEIEEKARGLRDELARNLSSGSKN